MMVPLTYYFVVQYLAAISTNQGGAQIHHNTFQNETHCNSNWQLLQPAVA